MFGQCSNFLRWRFVLRPQRLPQVWPEGSPSQMAFKNPFQIVFQTPLSNFLLIFLSSCPFKWSLQIAFQIILSSFLSSVDTPPRVGTMDRAERADGGNPPAALPSCVLRGDRPQARRCARGDAGPPASCSFTPLEPPISLSFSSFHLIFGRVIIARNMLVTCSKRECFL